MRPDGMVEIAVFTTDIAARVAETRLRAAGIDAHVDADDCGGMRPELAWSNGVRLYVPETEEHRARDLLVAAAHEELDRSAWTCPNCNERNDPAFDVCWRCGTERPA